MSASPLSKDEVGGEGGHATPKRPSSAIVAASTPATAATADGGNGSDGFAEQFKAFAKFGDSKATGEAAITLSNSDKWFKQSKVIDGKKVTTVDSGISFKKVAKTKKALNLKEYEAFLDEIAKSRKIPIEDIKHKLCSCGPPATRIQSATATACVARLTDTSKYTGTHKQRFDEAGKGKGKDGRVDSPKSSGYVSGYKEEGSFDSTHQ